VTICGDASHFIVSTQSKKKDKSTMIFGVCFFLPDHLTNASENRLIAADEERMNVKAN